MKNKHAVNKEKKLKQLLRRGAVCSLCGKPLSLYSSGVCCTGGKPLAPNDPGFMRAMSMHNVTTTPVTTYVPKSQPKEKSKTLEFVVPVWLENIRKDLEQMGFNPDHLKYQGRSKMTGTKSGKRKATGHRFVIDPPLPFKYENEETVFLWHGTGDNVLAPIVVGGFKPSYSGMLGRGVYLGEIPKARNYMRNSGDYGMLLYCEAALGVVENGEPHNYPTSGCDTVHCNEGNYTLAWSGRIRHKEWCVRDESRVVVREIHIIKKD